MEMTDIYKAADNPKIQLWLPNGAPIPSKVAAGRNWKFDHTARSGGGYQSAQIAKNGYFMCRVHEGDAGYDELF